MGFYDGKYWQEQKQPENMSSVQSLMCTNKGVWESALSTVACIILVMRPLHMFR
jgi:hypothetical protein